MKTKLSLCLITLSLLVSCGNSEKNNDITLQDLQNIEGNEVIKTENLNQYQDSIALLSNDIEALKNNQLAKHQWIISLNKKKDSINAILTQVQQSLNQVNTNKINPGIEGVNTKLAELKGERENKQEKLELQNKEVALAEKKIGLLDEEKTVYDAQHKALWAKGAAPEEFKEVDSLLNGINSKISEQAKRVKKLKSDITDVGEQIQSIDIQRNSLSGKIRNNYTAKQIFDEYSKDEQVRLKSQLTIIEDELKLIIEEDASISNTLALQNSRKNIFENEHSNAEKMALENELSLKAERTALLNQEDQTQKNNKKSIALIIVGLLALIIGVFYLLGKMRKSRKTKIK